MFFLPYYDLSWYILGWKSHRFDEFRQKREKQGLLKIRKGFKKLFLPIVLLYSELDLKMMVE
jgi:hypothetical protein